MQKSVVEQEETSRKRLLSAHGNVQTHSSFVENKKNIFLAKCDQHCSDLCLTCLGKHAFSSVFSYFSREKGKLKTIMLTFILGNRIDGSDADGITSCIFNSGLHLRIFPLLPSMSSI